MEGTLSKDKEVTEEIPSQEPCRRLLCPVVDSPNCAGRGEWVGESKEQPELPNGWPESGWPKSKEHPGYYEWGVERNMHILFGEEEEVEYGDGWETNSVDLEGGDREESDADYWSESGAIQNWLSDGQVLTFYYFHPDLGQSILSSLWVIPDEWVGEAHDLVMEESPFIDRTYYCFYKDGDTNYVLLEDTEAKVVTFYRRELLNVEWIWPGREITEKEAH